jgi:hypothetical protein
MGMESEIMETDRLTWMIMYSTQNLAFDCDEYLLGSWTHVRV